MKHTFRGAVSAWMVLIALRTIGTAGGSGRVAGLFTDVDNLVQRALSADVAAIPDRRVAGGGQQPTAAAVPMTTPHPALNGPARPSVQ